MKTHNKGSCSILGQDKSPNLENSYNENTFKLPSRSQVEANRMRQKQAYCNSKKLEILAQYESRMNKIVIIDSDERYLELVSDYAKNRGIQIDCFSSIEEFGNISFFSNYDTAIIEDYNGVLTGSEIGKIFDVFFIGKGIILISDKLFIEEDKCNFPNSIVGFFNKIDPVEKLFYLVQHSPTPLLNG